MFLNLIEKIPLELESY